MLNLLKHFNEKKKNEESFFSYQGVNTPIWTPCRYDALAEEGFQKNVIAYRAINLVSRSISSIPMTIVNRDGNAIDKKFTFLLERPNSSQARSTFIEQVVNYLLISGNAFVYCDDAFEFRCLRTDRIRIVPNRMKTDAESYL